ncbi:MAG: acetyl-CoA carboxylase biotin carboxylase subunit [Candidatus Eisenbacteria bacterium]|nr:acetyl-CoA carboxylase biotin carboxylase subunit [Candidatus Eisenbacteria bacterium]
MFKRVLIANRGEIALRILRACHELGIDTVAVFSEADRESLHVRLADQAVCIGPAAAAQSYLNIPRIIAAAEVSGADAIHPGYGFLAENAHFSEVVASCGLQFIGPTAEMIRSMGDKALARKMMKDAGVPIVPGSPGPVSGLEEALKVADEIGYPVMIKAVSGGGGKGMRMVTEKSALKNHLMMAQAEAEAAFGDGSVYIEHFVERPRHVEIQLLGDRFGNVIHLNERDCSVQRRNQKMIEESPSPAITPETRRAMGEAAVAGAKRIRYEGAGTIEFLLDPRGHFYFMEMNTRIQVEHPVTEEVTGLDLLKEQIRLAAGEPLGYGTPDIPMNGHAIECRVCAEDPAQGFRPSPGKITYLHMPGGPGIRVDSHVYSGYSVPANYDSLIGKIIARGLDRAEALRRMQMALRECIVDGVQTTIPLLIRILGDPEFQKGEVDTGYLARFLEASAAPSP